MPKVYTLKENVDLNELAKLDWDVVPNTNLVLFKIVPQELDSKLPNLLLENFYKNPEWIEKFYKPYKKDIVKATGLKYDKKGDIIMSSKFQKNLTTWYMEIDTSDSLWIGFRNLDPYNKKVLYNKSILDEFCAAEIEKLREANLIEEYEVGDA